MKTAALLPLRTAIMGRMAIDQKREMTWEEVMRS